jgi:hypothetical protein
MGNGPRCSYCLEQLLDAHTDGANARNTKNYIAYSYEIGFLHHSWTMRRPSHEDRVRVQLGGCLDQIVPGRDRR